MDTLKVLNSNVLKPTRKTESRDDVSNKNNGTLLFNTKALDSMPYQRGGRHTVSKTNGVIKESHGCFFSRFQAAGNALLRIFGIRSKSIGEQNASDFLRIAIDAFNNRAINIGSLDKDGAIRQLEMLKSIYGAGRKSSEEYFLSKKGKRDYTRLLFLEKIIKSRKLTPEEKKSIDLNLTPDEEKNIDSKLMEDLVKRHELNSGEIGDLREGLRDLCDDDVALAKRYKSIRVKTTSITEVKNENAADKPLILHVGSGTAPIILTPAAAPTVVGGVRAAIPASSGALLTTENLSSHNSNGNGTGSSRGLIISSSGKTVRSSDGDLLGQSSSSVDGADDNSSDISKAVSGNDDTTLYFREKVTDYEWNGGVYSGELFEEKPDGQGTLKFAYGSTLTGTWDDGVCVKGELKDNNGLILFIGEFNAANQPDGRGKSEFADGSTLTGTWKDGVCVNGVLKDNNGTTLDAGSFDEAHQLYNGLRRFDIKDRIVVKDVVQGGLGEKVMQAPESVWGEGNIFDENLLMNGRGVLVIGDREINGIWEHGVLKEGTGIVNYADGRRYEGALDIDYQPHGKGVLFFNDREIPNYDNRREKLITEWTHGSFSSSGVLTYLNTSEYDGKLNANYMPDGIGKLKRFDSKTLTVGEWENGQCKGPVAATTPKTPHDRRVTFNPLRN